jgi:cytochrome c553
MNKQIVLLAALTLAAPAAFAGGDAASGKQIVDRTCAACHSANGISNKGQDPQPPILAGQYKDYIIQALHEYKLNQRKGSPMNAMAAPLSEQDIKDVAEYFSNLPGPLGNLPHGE